MIVVAVLCFNEEKTIGSVVLKTKTQTGVDKVVVVDDGSWDNSREVAQLAGAEIISHECNQGYGMATISALRYGRRADCDILVTMDGDGQHDAADIPNLVRPIIENRADLVIGSRFLAKQQYAPLYRKVGQQVITLLGSLVYGCYVSDDQCGFRAFSKRALRSIRLKESGMGASVEIHQQIGYLGLRHVDVPVTVKYDS